MHAPLEVAGTVTANVFSVFWLIAIVKLSEFELHDVWAITTPHIATTTNKPTRDPR
jgi:hypothetical protein